MLVKHQAVQLRLTVVQARRIEQLSETLWPGEQLSLEEAGRRLLLEHLLWQESERRLLKREG